MSEVRVEPLAWDSEFWNERTAAIQFDDPSPAADHVRGAVATAQQNFDFVQMLVPASALGLAHIAERAGFLLVDMRCELEFELGLGSPAGKIGVPVRRARDDELSTLAELAAQVHYNTRFGADPFLPRARTREFYRRWIARDSSLPGWGIAVTGPDSSAHGYVTYGPSRDVGTIGLIGVAPGARQAGIGSALVAHATAMLLAQGNEVVRVVTQGGDVAAMRLYRSCGFILSRVDLWFHWHRRPRSRGST